MEELWGGELFVVYGFVGKYRDGNVWGGGVDKVGYEMDGMEIEVEELDVLYEFDEGEVREGWRMVKDIEEICYL
ncbi:hypothetical protein [Bacillus pumilus]|uniref:hypothetical protein n=1 Tax=Bacillus pumilus TaxID=1408 RepID=UPI00119DF18C|nr:hypothetical protein [Bacillus pumilus]